MLKKTSLLALVCALTMPFAQGFCNSTTDQHKKPKTPTHVARGGDGHGGGGVDDTVEHRKAREAKKSAEQNKKQSVDVK